MLQQFLVGIIFLGALGFLTNLMVRSFRAKEGCASGCGKCGLDAVRVNLPEGKSGAMPKP